MDAPAYYTSSTSKVTQAPQVVQAPAVETVSNSAGASIAFSHGVYTRFSLVPWHFTHKPLLFVIRLFSQGWFGFQNGVQRSKIEEE